MNTHSFIHCIINEHKHSGSIHLILAKELDDIMCASVGVLICVCRHYIYLKYWFISDLKSSYRNKGITTYIMLLPHKHESLNLIMMKG